MIGHLISSLRYNNSLVKKKKAYRWLKEYLSDKIRAKGKLVNRELSGAELRDIKAISKAEIIVKRSQNNRILLLAGIII